MSEKDIRRIARIMNGADGHCSHCASRLHDELIVMYPEHEAAIKEEWEKEFGYDV